MNAELRRIAHAIKENPALGEETISVLLCPYESRGRVQHMFSDLNRFVVKTSKSLDILYDRRDEFLLPGKLPRQVHSLEIDWGSA